ncbi:MAG: TetR/AcrR family transcriptional regulator [Thermodesulfobacteriota bacterium]
MKDIQSQDTQIAAILDAASTVFAEHGFAGARVDAIARAAGLNKAMLYYRVGDKARLYELVILSHFDRVSGAVESAVGAAGKGSDPVGALLKVIAGLFREDPRLPRIMSWEFASGGRTLPDGVAGRWARILGAVTPLASRAGMDPVLMYLALLGPMVLTCLTAPIRSRVVEGMPEPLRRVAEVDVDDMAGFLSQVFRKASGGAV